MHFVALRSDGTLWAWGYTGSGQRARPAATGVPNPTPMQIGVETNWADISVGAGHSWL